MTQNEFNVVLEQQYRKCADVLAHKKKEYTGDRIINTDYFCFRPCQSRTDCQCSGAAANFQNLSLPIIVQMGENNPMNLFHDSANDVKDRIGHPASIVFPVGAKANILLLPLVSFHCTTSFSFFTQVSNSGFLSAVLPYGHTHHFSLPDPLVILLLPRCHQKGQRSYPLRLRYAFCGR